MLNLYFRMKSFFDDEKGQALMEYGLILVLIAVVVALMLTGIGTSLSNSYSSINSAVQPPAGAGGG